MKITKRLFLGFFLIFISLIMSAKVIWLYILNPIETIVTAISNSNLTIYILLNNMWDLFLVAPIMIIMLAIVFTFGYFIVTE